MKVLQMKNPRITKSLSGGTSQSLLGLHTSLPAAHLGNCTGTKLHPELFQRKGGDSATQLLQQAAEPPAMPTGSSSCSMEAPVSH